MKNDGKLIFKVILGSVVLVMIMIFGLSKMGGENNDLQIDQSVLLGGAGLIKENGEIKASVVVFSDMQCPACRVADELTGELENMTGVRYVFRHYPLSMHRYALVAARAVESARLMGKGFEMMDLLFEKQSEWSEAPKIEEVLVEYGKSLGLDESIFRKNLESTETMEAVQRDISLGDSLRLSGTPTIYVNGEQIAADFVMTKVAELLK